MAKRKSSNGGFMTGAAEMIGGALGTVVGTISRFRADGRRSSQEQKPVTKHAAATKVASRKVKQATPKKAHRGRRGVKQAQKTLTPRRTTERKG